MAHPKSRISQQRRNTRRAHYKVKDNALMICSTTREIHQRHRAYKHEGNYYYKGKMVISAKDE